MPRRVARPCAQSGCPNLVHGKGSYCEEHTKKKRAQSDTQRGTSAQRGYGARWRKLRQLYLAENPLCADPFDDHAERGEIVPATQVDHVVAKNRGGTDEWDNLQGLCRACHDRKTKIERAGRWVFTKSTIPVTIVAGPPGAGKTAYIEERAKWGDLVVDVDALYAALSMLPWYEKPDVLLPFVMEVRDAVLARLSRPSQVRAAWVITSEADRGKLEKLSETLGGALVVLEVNALECVRRISQDERRADRWEQWQEIVNAWWRKWEETSIR